MSWDQRIRKALAEASVGHGRFSSWNGHETLTIPLQLLRSALDGNAAARSTIARTLDAARPGCVFSSWAGESGAWTVQIELSDFHKLVEEGS